ncbi:MAG: hypothetical protein ACI4T5_10570 [Prevotella sp.]
MAELLRENEIDAGAGYITDKGDWVSGYTETVDGVEYEGYAIQDLVNTEKGTYMSKIDDNTTNPDTDTTGSWRTLLNRKAIVDATAACKKATDEAGSAASLARGAAAGANDVTDAGRMVLAELEAGVEAQTAATVAAEQAAKAAQEAARPRADITGRPARMGVICPKRVSVGSRPVVEVVMEPESSNMSKVFQAWDGCKVRPDGEVIADAEGKAEFYVVATCNSSLFEKVEIEVVAAEAIRDENGEAIRDENGEEIMG